MRVALGQYSLARVHACAKHVSQYDCVCSNVPCGRWIWDWYFSQTLSATTQVPTSYPASPFRLFLSPLPPQVLMYQTLTSCLCSPIWRSRSNDAEDSSTHARNYSISTVHTTWKTRFNDTFGWSKWNAVGECKSAECIINTRKPWTLWNNPKMQGVNTKDEIGGYGYVPWCSSTQNSRSNR